MYSIYGIEDSYVSRENLCYIICFFNKQLRCENSFYCVIIIVK